MKKKCTKCKLKKDLDMFSKSSYSPDGKRYWCKKCEKKVTDYHNSRRPHKIRTQPRVRDMRKLAIEKLGGKCAWCGFDDIRALQLDHIHGNGSSERKSMSQYSVYKKIFLSVSENKKEYQVLCANCNWIKRHENHEN